MNDDHSPELVAPVDPHHAIERAVSLAAGEIAHRARLVQELEAVPAVLASDRQLTQVLLDLILNAARAIDVGDSENNQLRLRTWSDGHRVFIEVSDTGRGIPAEQREQLFDPHFSRKGVGMGIGLGLAICKEIVNGFGGEIRFGSSGEGTCCVVELPALPRDWAGGVAPELRPTPARGRILIVDDEPGIRNAITRLLGREHEVVCAPSGEAGQAILESDQAFDLLYFDLMLPELSGMDLYGWLLQRNPLLASQVVFITGGAFTPAAREFLAEVSNLRVEKPFDVNGFREQADELVRAARARRKD